MTISGPPEVPLRYKVSNLMDFVNWLNSLTVVGAEPQLVTWFHLNLLYEKALGFQYSKSHKRWRFVQTDTKYLGLVQRSNHFRSVHERSTWSDRVWMHLRPNSVAIPFWTQCVFLRIRPNLLEEAERAFMEYAPQFASVKMLRQLV